MSNAGVLERLIPAQQAAVEPGDNIWLSASAGTGKTQVLTARVIRLLLEPGIKPEQLLCITFTKAGAAEMSERINRLLAAWVQMENQPLACDLQAIGADESPETCQRARQLFASVLDAPGGGLQIMTIHSLCQSLLASFPEEAGLVPGFKPVEGREQDELHREALAELIIEAEDHGLTHVITYLQELSLSLGEEGVIRFLRRCASQPGAMDLVPEDMGAIKLARGLVGISYHGPLQQFFAEQTADHAINRPFIEAIAQMNTAWGAKTGIDRAHKINEWLAMDSAERGTNFALLHSAWSNQKGEFAKVVPKDDTYAHIALDCFQWGTALLSKIDLMKYAERLGRALLIGKAFADHYAESKRVRGLVDFDDMIRKTASLLGTSGMADWVRFKLDRQFDHILIDESQDTNVSQWSIVTALCDDFFSGLGAKAERSRTIFSVGDYKQAIYGFQGTDPEQYREAGLRFADTISRTGSELHKLSLSQSFRSTKPVLDLVNAMFATSGPEKYGISDLIEDHFSEKADIGSVELLQPVLAQIKGDSEEGSDDEEAWLSDEKRRLAHRLASTVAELVHEAPYLVSKGSPLQPSDIMILLRRRGDFASLLVAQLHARGVPVAGIDRLRLQEPLAVQDLLATIRFGLQPNDDLSLACILVSPLIGWSQQQLLDHGHREKGVSLWQHLRNQPEIESDIEPLRSILASVDFTTAYQFLEMILSGPIAGRKKLVARLGTQALVPVEELLNAALQFEQNQGGTLQAFLAWFERGETEIKRENVAGNNEVRVMTVHGAKGLQAPVVILADVTSDPEKKPDRSIEVILDEHRMPMLPVRKAERHGQLDDAVSMQEERERAEHFRLLYVAITRAQERLILAGSVGTSRKGEPPEYSWYPALLDAMSALGCDWVEDARWGRVMRYCGKDRAVAPSNKNVPATPLVAAPLPQWLLTKAPDEARPPRPLTPSQLSDDDYGDAPPSAFMQLASEKGRLIHALFEKITGPDIAQSLHMAEIWLRANNRNADIDNAAILSAVKSVIEDSDCAAFFTMSAKAEVPLAAVVGETVITGRVDRLIIEPGRIRILDFKTGRNVPQSAEAVSIPFLRQMAHYVAALEVIFPEHVVEANLIYSHGPKLITLPDAILDPHKPNP
jgi:ATP-dependent helicase/nuclease subunit A